jgi:hypothetical protein
MQTAVPCYPMTYCVCAAGRHVRRSWVSTLRRCTALTRHPLHQRHQRPYACVCVCVCVCVQLLVLACDGVWDVCENEDAGAIVRAIVKDGEAHLKLICEELLDQVRVRVCMYLCMYVRMYVCMHVCMCVYVCFYVVHPLSAPRFPSSRLTWVCPSPPHWQCLLRYSKDNISAVVVAFPALFERHLAEGEGVEGRRRKRDDQEREDREEEEGGRAGDGGAPGT